MNNVQLTLFLMFVLAPVLVNILTAVALPFLDAICRGVSPFCINTNTLLIGTYT